MRHSVPDKNQYFGYGRKKERKKKKKERKKERGSFYLLNVSLNAEVRRNTAAKFKVCKSLHHRTIQINHQPDATIFQFIILTFIYSSTCFGRSPAHRQELNDCSSSLWFYILIVVIAVLCSWSGWLPARPRTQHVCHH